jgi:hypothetical protein
VDEDKDERRMLRRGLFPLAHQETPIISLVSTMSRPTTTANVCSTMKSPPKFEGDIHAMDKTKWWETLKTLGWIWPARSDYRVTDVETGSLITTTSNPDRFMLENGIPNVKHFKKLPAGIQQLLEDQIKRSFINRELLTRAKTRNSTLSYEYRPMKEFKRFSKTSDSSMILHKVQRRRFGPLVMRNPLPV